MASAARTSSFLSASGTLASASTLVAAADLAQRTHLEALFGCDVERVADELGNHLVAHRRHADALTGTHRIADHACACERLAGARRALNGEHVTVDLVHQASRRRHRGLAVTHERAVVLDVVCAIEQEIRHRAVRSIGIHAVLHDPSCEPQQRLVLGPVRNMIVRERQPPGARVPSCPACGS